MHLYRCSYSHIKGISTISLGGLDDLDATWLGLDQTHELFGRQPFDFRCPEPQLCQNGSTVLANAWCGAWDVGRGAIETGRGFGLADAADIRMVQLGDQFACQYLLVGDHLIASQYRR